MAPTGKYRVLQVHPTRRCNLRCLHCYSLSGPEVEATLELEVLNQAVSDAAQEGYGVMGVSGGEPLLYKPLPQLLEHAHGLGLITTVTSNGMLLAGRLDKLVGHLDLLAISLDGLPASHNHMRQSERAFEKMQGNLARVRDSGLPFGFIFTLTQHNLHELDWVADFALEQEAKLLQIHPLEEVGRAHKALRGSRPDETEQTFAFLEVARLQEKVGDALFIQLDLVEREGLEEHPEQVFAGALPEQGRLSDLVSPLIIETDGTVAPLQYGFDRRLVLGNLHQDSLSRLAHHWYQERYGRFRAVCRQAFETITAPDTMPLSNWYEVVAQTARAS